MKHLALLSPDSGHAGLVLTRLVYSVLRVGFTLQGYASVLPL